MRLLLIVMLCGAVFVGCRHGSSSENPFAFKPKKGRENKAAEAQKTAQPAAQPAVPRVQPLNELSGRIASVNAALRFAVLDFHLAQLPSVDQRLAVFRQGQKVGEVKVTGPVRDHNIVADIVAGEAQIGDEVRAN
jgi:hypothetical protein